MQSTKYVYADLKCENKTYQVVDEEKTIWDDMWKPNDYFLASSEGNIWRPRGFYSFRDFDENVAGYKNSYYCFERDDSDKSVSGSAMSDFLSGKRGSYSGIRKVAGMQRSGMVLYKVAHLPIIDHITKRIDFDTNKGTIQFKAKKYIESSTSVVNGTYVNENVVRCYSGTAYYNKSNNS
jgi:hypothetical protein